MRYIPVVSAILLACIWTSLASAENFHLTASGSPGSDGQSGARGDSGPIGFGWNSGEDGRDGRDGGVGSHGRDGLDGGSIQVRLEYANPEKTQIRITGRAGGASSSRVVDHLMPLSSAGRISLFAEGGDGGRGGRGGEGGAGGGGSRGADGRDGCPATDGQDGGDGGDGGRGGRGGDGGSGGIGGEIFVEVPEDQSELLLLVRTSISGGRAGGAGSGGFGGSSGSSGWGGSAGRNHCDSKTISIARSGSSGSSGRRGDDGWQGQEGRSGTSGRAEMVVAGLLGRRSFPKPFVLRLSRIEFLDSNRDGMIEPGETFSVTGLEVINHSDMPTPRGQKILLGFRSTEALQMLGGAEVNIGSDFGAQETRRFEIPEGALVFRASSSPGLARLALSLRLNAIQTEIGSDAVLTVQEPLAVTLAGAEARGVFFGQSHEVRLAIQNISSKPIGLGSERPVRWSLEWLPKKPVRLDGEAIRVTGLTENPVDLSQRIGIELPLLAPGESKELTLELLVDRPGSLFLGEGALRLDFEAPRLSEGGTRSLWHRELEVVAAVDLTPMAFQQKFELKNLGLKCVFPEATVKHWTFSGLEIQKLAGSESVSVKVSVGTFLARRWSPEVLVPVHAFAAFESLSRKGSPSAAVIETFLNQQVVPLLRTSRDWSIERCGRLN